MITTKFVAKAATSKLFIGENGSIITDPDKAIVFDNPGDCMRACIEANNNLGKAAFSMCQISVNENNKKAVS